MPTADPPDHRAAVTGPELASWVLAGIALLLILVLRLLPALIAGLLVYELVAVMAPPLQRHFSGARSRMVSLVALITAVILLITAATFGVLEFLERGGGISALLQKIADIVEGSRGALPEWLTRNLPADVEGLRSLLSEWLRGHAQEIGRATGEAGRTLAHIIIGIAIGAILALHSGTKAEQRPLARALSERGRRFGDAFRQVMFAQARISAINTAATAVYLAGILPLFGVELPFKATLIGLTFVTGLLPVVGNLLSNSAIVIVSLAHSIYVAAASLVFLVVIHKGEYLLNARIVGSRIHARAWELLVAMVALEAAFGIGGLIAAPIYYAYIKGELADRGLV
jgi:predicted PurR-regulated permease PerM